MLVGTTLPANADSISGATSVCSNSLTNIVYTTPAISGATSYNWVIPSGITIVSGQNTNSITVDYSSSFTSGSISVAGTNACGSGNSTSIAVAVSPGSPATPGTVSGPNTNACTYTLTPATYSVAPVSGATSYTWSVPAGASLAGGQGTNAISVTFVSTYSTGVISVVANNNCGSSAAKTLTVYPGPSVPGTISGPSANVCPGSVSYSVTAVTGATYYNWTVPSGMTVSAGQGSNSISVVVDNTFTSGTVSVTASNGCKTSAARTLTVTSVPATPGTISGPNTNACTYSSPVTYSVAPVSGAISYTWTVPTGATLVSGQGTNSITVTFVSTYSTGVISVIANSNCASSAAKTLTVYPGPSVPGTISGPSSNVCAATATYSVSAVAGATYYNWTVPAGITIGSGQGTNSIFVAIDTTFTSGTISVTASNGCKTSSARTLSITRIPLTPGNISGPNTNACTYTSVPATYSVALVTGASSYTWTVPAGATIVSGQGTNSIDLTFVSTYSTGVISVTANNSCESSAAKTMTVYPGPSVPGTISGETSGVCEGVNMTYSVAVVAGATYYNWTLPVGITLISGQGTNAISVTFDSGFTSGTMSVTASNGCKTSAARTLSVTATPATPGSISGPTTNLCSTTSTYSITPVNGATGYNWLVAGGTIVSGQGTNSISVTFFDTITSGYVKVKAMNNCGSGAYKGLNISNCTGGGSAKFFSDEIPVQQININRLYPNPVSSVMTIEINSISEADIFVQTIDISGKTIESKKLFLNSGDNSILMNVGDYKEGIYIIKFTDGTTKQTYYKKFVVQK